MCDEKPRGNFVRLEEAIVLVNEQKGLLRVQKENLISALKKTSVVITGSRLAQRSKQGYLSGEEVEEIILDVLKDLFDMHESELDLDERRIIDREIKIHVP